MAREKKVSQDPFKGKDEIFAKLGRQANIDITKLEYNDGQLDGISKNPRYLKDAEHDTLKKSLKDSPELLEYKPLMVYPLGNDKYITICGNMRLRVANELRSDGCNEFDTIPCFILKKDTPIEKIKEYAIKDNVQAGNWDWDELANGEWETDDLQDWGVDCSFLMEDEEPEEGGKEKEEKDYSDEIVSEYKLEVNCKNEETLQALYEELTERELECRILTL